MGDRAYADAMAMAMEGIDAPTEAEVGLDLTRISVETGTFP